MEGVLVLVFFIHPTFIAELNLVVSFRDASLPRDLLRMWGIFTGMAEELTING